MSLSYAVGQSIKYENHPAKHSTWCQIVTNMQSGLITAGSRTPIANVPLWATPEVAHGGFATGKLRAGGELAAYERALAEEARTQCYSLNEKDSEDTTLRSSANRYLIEHEAGIKKLFEMFHSRNYRVNVPEEGCLLAYAWLIENEFTNEAHELLKQVSPWFDQLRFHPEPRDEPEDTSRVSIQSVLEVKTLLQESAAGFQRSIDAVSSHALDEHLETWYHLREELLELWILTLDDPSQPPDGSWSLEKASGDQGFVFTEGSSWPCQQYPDGWSERAASMLARYEKPLRAQNWIQARLRRKYARMIDSLKEVVVKGPTALTGRDVAWIRFGIATANVRRGLPGSSKYQKWLDLITKARENRIQALQTLRSHYTYTIECLDSIARTDTTRNEMKEYLLPSEAQILCAQISTAFLSHKNVDSILSTLDKATGLDLSEVFNSGSFKSLEMVAQILPKFTSSIRTSALPDPNVAYLYQQILIAFAERRSLLLLSFASQVRAGELPWMSTIDRLVLNANDNADLKLRVQKATTEFCRAVVINALKRFGEVPLCNPFIGELKPLMGSVESSPCFLLEELAADIFMGSFTPKYTRAYQVAQEYLEGTKYQKYYGIKKLPTGDTDTKQFAALCYSRAGVLESDGSRWSVSANAQVIEQCQILTSHNLATLFITFDLHEHLEELNVPAILERCWNEIMRLAVLLKRTPASDWRMIGPLRRFIGYTWRQMLFFFAVLEKYEAPETYLEAVVLMERKIASLPEDDKYRAHFTALAKVLRSKDGEDTSDNMSDIDANSQPGTTPPYVVAWGADRI